METRETDVTTPDGVMGAYEIIPDGEGPRPAIVFLMDGLGYRAALKTMAERLASHGGHARSTSRAWPSGETESRGQKSDEKDAFELAEQLRTGALKKRVFKEVGEYGTLRELGRTHTMVVQDVVRVQNRIRALLRSRGIAPTGKNVYSEKGREELLAELPDASRGAAKTLYAQYDAAPAIRRQAEKELVAEAHRHAMSRVLHLKSCPGLGPIRVAQLMPIVVSPARFRTKRQFWSYCGLGIVMRSSSDWVQKPEGAGHAPRCKQTRGLNYRITITR
jgi:transposase